MKNIECPICSWEAHVGPSYHVSDTYFRDMVNSTFPSKERERLFLNISTSKCLTHLKDFENFLLRENEVVVNRNWSEGSSPEIRTEFLIKVRNCL